MRATKSEKSSSESSKSKSAKSKGEQLTKVDTKLVEEKERLNNLLEAVKGLKELHEMVQKMRPGRDVFSIRHVGEGYIVQGALEETMEQLEAVTKEFFEEQGIVYRAAMFAKFKQYMLKHKEVKERLLEVKDDGRIVEQFIKLIEKKKLAEAL